MSDLLQQGITAFRSGKRDEARRFIAAFIKQDPNNETGWRWLFNVCDTDTERYVCLSQMVRINPQNEKASQLLKEYSSPKQPVEQPVKLPAEQPVMEKQPGHEFKLMRWLKKLPFSW